MEDETIVPAPASVYKAEVWQHFGFRYRQGTKEIDKSHAVCKMCNANVKYSKNTTNLRVHIMRHHSDVPLTEQQQQTANGKRVDPLQLTLEQVHTSKLPPTSTRATKITINKSVSSLFHLQRYALSQSRRERRLPLYAENSGASLHNTIPTAHYGHRCAQLVQGGKNERTKIS